LGFRYKAEVLKFRNSWFPPPPSPPTRVPSPLTTMPNDQDFDAKMEELKREMARVKRQKEEAEKKAEEDARRRAKEKEDAKRRAAEKAREEEKARETKAREAKARDAKAREAERIREAGVQAVQGGDRRPRGDDSEWEGSDEEGQSRCVRCAERDLTCHPPPPGQRKRKSCDECGASKASCEWPGVSKGKRKRAAEKEVTRKKKRKDDRSDGEEDGVAEMLEKESARLTVELARHRVESSVQAAQLRRTVRAGFRRLEVATKEGFTKLSYTIFEAAVRREEEERAGHGRGGWSPMNSEQPGFRHHSDPETYWEHEGQRQGQGSGVGEASGSGQGVQKVPSVKLIVGPPVTDVRASVAGAGVAEKGAAPRNKVSS
jgi:hypothetical protein